MATKQPVTKKENKKKPVLKAKSAGPQVQKKVVKPAKAAPVKAAPVKAAPAKAAPAKAAPAKAAPASMAGTKNKQETTKKTQSAPLKKPLDAPKKKAPSAPLKAKGIKDKEAGAHSRRPVASRIIEDLNLGDKLQKRKEVAWRLIEGEAVVMTPAESMMYTLNETGTRIWELMTPKRTLQDLSEVLSEEFDVPQDKIVADVLWFSECLYKKGLVERL